MISLTMKKEEFEQLADYLARRPWYEVNKLMQLLQNAKPSGEEAQQQVPDQLPVV
jgi:hypothetical protein